MNGIKRAVAALLVTALVAGVTVGILSVGVAQAGASGTNYSPKLNPALQPVVKFESSEAAATFVTASTAKRTVAIAPAVTQAKTNRVMTSRPATSGSTSSATSSSSSTTKQQEAQRILNEFIGRYPILQGTTVTFGDAKGYQAIAYYQSGRIIISPTHKASLYTIIEHECWHIIDYRHHGKIVWGENIPPANWRDYVGK